MQETVTVSIDAFHRRLATASADWLLRGSVSHYTFCNHEPALTLAGAPAQNLIVDRKTCVW